MPRSHAYPPDLARYVEANWPGGVKLTLSSEQLEEALGVAFQASLTLEEARPTRFRLLLTSPEKLPAAGAPKQGV
ncbi:MAG: putative sensor domain DACNV-containing protein, partial [Myxococcales bacterium]